MKFNLEGVLGFVPLAIDDEGPSSSGQAKRRKTATKAKRVVGDKNALVSAGRAMEDDHIDLTMGVDPMHADDDHTAGDSSVPDLLFPPSYARRDMEVMRSYVISHMSEDLSRRKIEDIEKDDAVESYKTSSEYQQDLYAYGAESMSASISLTKEWISTEHPGVNPQDFDRFLARRQDLEQAVEQGQAAEQDGADDQADDPLQDEDGASQLD
ncbi:hypothetical protein Adt_45652 [Abeliophyllum distichum]|uniref:Uncharacterized protein n=1 Tax=Abeliophyllum distichum TaxID=126358 RepID=A0ABD1PF02_9LAMI